MIRMMLTFTDSEYKSLNHYAKGKGVSVEETIKEVLQGEIFNLYPVFYSLYSDEPWSAEFREMFAEWSHNMVKILRNQVFIGIAEGNADFEWLERAMKHLVDEYLLSMQVLVPLYHASNMAKHENILAEMREEALKNGMPDDTID